MLKKVSLPSFQKLSTFFRARISSQTKFLCYVSSERWIPWNFWGLIVFDCVFSVKIVSISIVSVSLARSPSPFSEAMVSDEICAVFQRVSPRCANIEQGSLLYGTNIAGVGFCIACTLGQVVQNKTFLSGREGYMQKSTLRKIPPVPRLYSVIASYHKLHEFNLSHTVLLFWPNRHDHPRSMLLLGS